MMLHSTLAVFRFELSRTLTISRVAVWLLLTSFPIFIVCVVKYNEDSLGRLESNRAGKVVRAAEWSLGNGNSVLLEVRQKGSQHVGEFTVTQAGTKRTFALEIPDNIPLSNTQQIREWMESPAVVLALQGAKFRGLAEKVDSHAERKIPDIQWGIILFTLIPEVTTLFGLLLWVTPVVQAELEGRTWIYLAVRPRGRASTLLGKYLTAITWTALSGWVSATVCVWVAQPQEALRMWSTIVALVGLACLGYGALYSLIAVFLHRRAMVIAVAYTLVFELLVSFIPAVINQFTVQYRLRNLGVDFMDWRSLISEEVKGIWLGTQPAWSHILILVGVTILLLVLATLVIQRKEYATAEEA